MAAKNVTLQVIADAIQLVDGRAFYNGQQFEVSQKLANELWKTGKVVKA